MENAKQTELFIESINDALRDAVRALGGQKKVGAQLKPQKLADDAGRWLADCLHADRREHLDPEQILWILREARKIGCHSTINWICQEAGYGTPQPVEPEDEKAKLMRDFIAATEQQTRNVKRLEALGGITLKAVA